MSISQFPAPSEKSGATTYKIKAGSTVGAVAIPAGLYKIDSVATEVYPITLSSNLLDASVYINDGDSEVIFGDTVTDFQTPEGVEDVEVINGPINRSYFTTVGSGNSNRIFVGPDTGSFGSNNSNEQFRYSDDNGETWAVSNKSGSWNATINGLVRNHPDPDRPQEGNITTSMYVYGNENNDYNRAISNDNGANWSAYTGNNNLYHSVVGDKIIFASQSGIEYSNSTFPSNVTFASGPNTQVYQVAYDGTKYYAMDSSETAWVSDTGTSWTSTATTVSNANFQVGAMAASPNVVISIDSSEKVYRSTDQGQTYTTNTTLSSSIKKLFYFGLTNTGTFLATTNSGNFFWSTDDGATWTPKTNTYTNSAINHVGHKPDGAGTNLYIGGSHNDPRRARALYVPSYITLTPLSELEYLTV